MNDPRLRNLKRPLQGRPLGFVAALVPVVLLACGAVATGPGERSEEPTSFAESMLAAHNACRAPFGVPELVWSPDLAAFSQEWADHLARADDKLKHRRKNRYGENLYWISGGEATPEQVVESWCAEQRLFDPERNDWWPNAAHFSQVVWNNTKQVGCAVARQEDKEWWVCNYDPPGNFRGRKPY